MSFFKLEFWNKTVSQQFNIWIPLILISNTRVIFRTWPHQIFSGSHRPIIYDPSPYHPLAQHSPMTHHLTIYMLISKIMASSYISFYIRIPCIYIGKRISWTCYACPINRFNEKHPFDYQLRVSLNFIFWYVTENEFSTWRFLRIGWCWYWFLWMLLIVMYSFCVFWDWDGEELTSLSMCVQRQCVWQDKGRDVIIMVLQTYLLAFGFSSYVVTLKIKL